MSKVLNIELVEVRGEEEDEFNWDVYVDGQCITSMPFPTKDHAYDCSFGIQWMAAREGWKATEAIRRYVAPETKEELQGEAKVEAADPQ